MARLACLAQAAVKLSGLGQGAGLVGLQRQGLAQRLFCLRKCTPLDGQLGEPQVQHGVVRVTLKQWLVYLAGFCPVATGAVHARQRRHGLRRMRALLQRRGQHVVSSHQVISFAQLVGLFHAVAVEQVGVLATGFVIQVLVFERAQNLAGFGILVALEQYAGLEQAGRCCVALQPLHQSFGLFGLAGFGVGRGDHSNTLRLAGCAGFSLCQQRPGRLALAAPGQLQCLFDLQVQLAVLLQASHCLATACGRNALQRALHISPGLALR
ncbi:hypothetical protein D3C81_820610 [compost metagenome]